MNLSQKFYYKKKKKKRIHKRDLKLAHLSSVFGINCTVNSGHDKQF